MSPKKLTLLVLCLLAQSACTTLPSKVTEKATPPRLPEWPKVAEEMLTPVQPLRSLSSQPLSPTTTPTVKNGDGN